MQLAQVLKPKNEVNYQLSEMFLTPILCQLIQMHKTISFVLLSPLNATQHNRLLGCGTNSNVFTHTDLQVHRPFSSRSLTVLHLQNKFVASCRKMKTEQDLFFILFLLPFQLLEVTCKLNLTRTKKKKKYRRTKTFSRTL